MSNSSEASTETDVPAWDRAPAEPAPRRRKAKSGWWSLVKLLAIFAVCLAVGGQLLWSVSNHFFPPEVLAGLREPTESPRETAAAPAATAPPSRVIDTNQAVQRSKLMRAESDIQTAQTLLAQVRDQQAKWAKLVPGLLSSDSKQGRRLAADPAATRLLLGAIDRERLDASELERLRSALLELAVPVDAAIEDESAVLKLSSEFTTELATITERLRTGLKRWQDDNALVRVLLKEAEGQSEGDQTLRDAIEGLRAAETRRRAEKINEEVAAAKAVLDEKEAAARMRLQELEAQQRLESEKLETLRQEAKLAGLKVEQDVLRDQIDERRRRADLERRFQADLPEIRRVLTAFITPGHKQIVDGKWKRVEQKQPVSLSGLHATRTLGDDSMSQMYLYHAGGASKNDRPNGPFRDYIGGSLRDHETALVQKARRFLLDYGNLMVEKGMLMP